MAVEFRSLKFGEVDSAEYGIFLTGEGVFNAPERDVQFVEVPGRNGNIAIDQGRYKNIEVTYKAGTFDSDPERFAGKLAKFRNAILSQKGYQRLSDTYHPEEYRMGIYVSGFKVTPASLSQGGEFDLVFNCKPQRWLVSGELPVLVTSGDIFINSTPFEANPMLEVEGYGSIQFNGHIISLGNGTFGKVNLFDPVSFELGRPTMPIDDGTHSYSEIVEFNPGIMNENDTFSCDLQGSMIVHPASGYALNGNVSVSGPTGTVTPTAHNEGKIQLPGGHTACIASASFELGYVFGTASTKTCTITVSIPLAITGGGSETLTFRYVLEAIYDGDHKITFNYACEIDSGHAFVYMIDYSRGAGVGNSTANVLGHPTLIDCDLGEAYRLDDGYYTSLNNKIGFGSDLPALPAGATKVTYSNTITSLKIIPRWWIL